jgi:hypothetical protein
MPCNDLIGADWIPGLLVVDGGDEVIIDPPLEISNPSGSQLVGVFSEAGETEFNVTCRETGPVLMINFTRVHPDGRTTTDYRGRVVGFGDRAFVGVIRGRFQRNTLRDGRLVPINGDWETERPT